jgi:hypothetical protein
MFGENFFYNGENIFFGFKEQIEYCFCEKVWREDVFW